MCIRDRACTSSCLSATGSPLAVLLIRCARPPSSPCSRSLLLHRKLRTVRVTLRQLERRRIEQRLEAPLLDMNYGVGDRIQLKFEMPWVWLGNREDDTLTSGAGNATAGVK